MSRKSRVNLAKIYSHIPLPTKANNGMKNSKMFSNFHPYIHLVFYTHFCKHNLNVYRYMYNKFIIASAFEHPSYLHQERYKLYFWIATDFLNYYSWCFLNHLWPFLNSKRSHILFGLFWNRMTIHSDTFWITLGKDI